jgi:hypothetical protein
LRVYPEPSKAVKDELLGQVADLVKQADPTHQELAERLYEMFRERATKAGLKELGLDILNWLDGQPRINSNFLPSLRMVLTSQSSFKKEDRARIFKVIFDLWVLQETDENQINIAKQLSLNIPRDTRDGYYQKIDGRINAMPQLTEALNQLKDKMEADSTSK